MILLCNGKGLMCKNNSHFKIYRELFEPNVVNVFVQAYNSCYKGDPEVPDILVKYRENYEKDPNTGLRLFSRPTLYILDKVMQKKFDPNWQIESTTRFESSEYYKYYNAT